MHKSPLADKPPYRAYASELCYTDHFTENSSYCKMDGKLYMIYFVNFAVSTVFTSVIPFYPIIALQKGVDFVVIGVIIAAMPIFTFFASLVLGGWLERVGRNRALLSGIVLAVRTK
jgi:predicted MFS family arabinose efflux permease